MTLREFECLDAIKARIAMQCVSPTLTELGADLGILSKSGVFRLLDALERQGAISRDRRRHRSIRVLDSAPLFGVPTAELVAELRRRGEVLP